MDVATRPRYMISRMYFLWLGRSILSVGVHLAAIYSVVKPSFPIRRQQATNLVAEESIVQCKQYHGSHNATISLQVLRPI